MEGPEKSQSSYYALSYFDRLPNYSPHCSYGRNKTEQHISTKCSKCNTFQVISDLLHEFMNFNALKIILKVHKKIIKIIKKDPGLILVQTNLTCGLVHICNIREKSLQ